MTTYAITTVDNPYDPFDDFDSWYRFDMDKGYNSCALLARIAFVPESYTKYEEAKETERAIDEIIKYDVLNLYKKVKKDVENS